jgi:plastocyanin
MEISLFSLKLKHTERDATIGRMSALTAGLVGVMLFALAGVATPTFAADQTVTARPDNTFVPNPVTVTVGEKVTWSNGGGTHNVHFDDNSFVQPTRVDSTPWTVSRTFTTTGSFRYYCEAHVAQGMSGTVNVNAAAPGTTAPGGGPPAPILADRVAPKLALASRRSQRVLKQRGLRFTAQSDEPATLRARGSVNVPGAGKILRFRSVKAQLAAGVERRVKLRLARKALRSVKRALRRGSRLFARVTVNVEDKNGNVDTAKRRIRLR